MSEQEVFNSLSELEEFFYYRLQNPGGLPWNILAQLHNEIKTALVQWHNLTGCKNE
jgi:hypothetical protein